MSLLPKLLNSALLLMLLSPAPVSSAELSVFAASSLTEALAELVRRYEIEHPEDQIRLNFAGSQTLATQLELGAPADLFISANQPVMARLENQGLVEKSQPLLGNRLVVAARPDLQPQLATLKDLARPDLLLAVGNHQVPVGRYTRQLFASLSADASYGSALVKKIGGNIVSEECRVKAIIAKLLLGEVDAGFIYQSDLASGNASRLTAIPLPEKYNPPAVYPLAKVIGAKSEIDHFADFLFSAAAQDIFSQHGFSPGAPQ